MYKHHPTVSTLIIRIADGAQITPDPASSAYQAVLAWVAAGNTIAPADPLPPPTQDELDAAAARDDTKVAAFGALTPANIRTYISNNFPTLTAAERDKLATLAVVVGIMARRI